MTMQDLMDDQPPEQYEPLFNAFRRGYERLCPWMEQYEGEMDTFRAGRMLWVANYVARVEGEYFADFIQRRLPMMRAFLETGTLRKPVNSARYRPVLVTIGAWVKLICMGWV